MVYMDDLQTRVEQSGSDILGDITDFFKKRATEEFVKYLPANGNLSAAEIAQGKKGENPNASVTPAAVPASQLTNANQASQMIGFMQSNYMPILAVAVVGLVAFIALKKG